MSDLDLTEAIEMLALEMTGRRGMPQEARTWEDLGPIAHETYRGEAKEVIDLVAPIIERAVRERIAQDIEASIVTAEARYGNCTCLSGKTCHPHACHEAMNRVTSRADEDTWPVHIACGVWNELDPLIRRHAAAIARGEVSAR